MFAELKDLLKTRGLLLTLASTDGDRIRVTVTPRPKSDEEKKKPIIPLVVEGTAEELDAEFAKTIDGFTEKLLSFEESVNEAQASMDAELKAIKDEAAKKIAEAKKTNKVSTTTTRAASTRPAPQVETAGGAKPKIEEPVLSLFDEPAPAPPQTAATPAAETNTADIEEENDSNADHSNAA
jgi:PRTRC genetic system protein E